MSEKYPELNKDYLPTQNPADLETVAYPNKYADGPLKLIRNAHGLFENVDYKYTPEGFVSWREMINPAFLYPNKGYFERAGKPVPDSAEGLEDNQILCKLGGYKELARLRGFSNIEYKLEYLENGVSCICTITWFPNYETRLDVDGQNKYSFADTVTFSSIANSTSENCGDFMASFKETQAENRAFVRCVRNFLNVNIVGDDEIGKGKVVVEQQQENSPDALNPQKNLESQAIKKGFKSYEQFKSDFLIPKKFSPKEKPKTNWTGYSDIPANECWRISSLLNE